MCHPPNCTRLRDDAAARRSSDCSAIRCDGSWSSSSVAAIAGSASSCSSSGSRRTWSRTTWPSSGSAGIVSARRSSADGRDVYYRADLFRCRDLLGDAGLVAPSRALARADATRRRRAPRRARPRLLFLCTGNSARSQIAEALVEHRSAGAVEARSAGSHPKPLHPNAVRVMAERGIDIAGRPTKSLTRFARNRFDRVITLCDKVREVCPEFPGAPIAAHWSIADPAAAGDTDDGDLPRVPATSPTRSRAAWRCCSPTSEPDQLERTHHG